MTPYHVDPLVTLYLGDCLEVMPILEPESVDAVVTDPPYGLSFMGKHWDHGVPGVDFWTAMLRVARPGGYLLAFGGTRTVHRIAANIEDAGWIIRDQLSWIYASGFPKGRANLKPAHEPIVLARKPGPLRPLGIDECRISTEGETFSVPQSDPAKRAGTVGTDLGISRADVDDFQAAQRASIERTQTLGRWPSNLLLSDPELFDEPNPGVVGSGAVSNPPGGPGRQADYPAGMFGATEQGPLYFDGGGYSRFFRVPSNPPINNEQIEADDGVSVQYPRAFIIPKSDRAERERGLGEATGERVFMGSSGRTFRDGEWHETHSEPKKRANVHPTVKPIDLMRHLVRLVTPPGGVCLDPFLGSGTTALAASEEGMRCIGIEREREYLDIAVGRLIATPMGLGLSTELVGKKRTPGGHSVGTAGRTYERDGKGYGSITESRRPFDYGDQPRPPKAVKPKADSTPMFTDEEPAA